MKLSVIIPSHNSQATLPRTLESLAKAAEGLDVETIVIDDPDRMGPSWARNRGLDRAVGELIFFCDADDTVRPDFFRRPMAELERTGAEMCFFTYGGGPRLTASLLDSNAEIRRTYLPAFFGYSFDDVRRWNRGGRLAQFKQLGQVWRCAYRRDFLERHHLRFDEAMTFYEDAAFLSACVSFAGKVATIPDELYNYLETPGGNLASGSGSIRHWEYKFLVLAFRKRLDEATGGAVWRYCEASCVFSALEMMRLWRSAGLSRRQYAEEMSRYLADHRVHAALRGFPISVVRHPLVALAVTWLRVRSWWCPPS